MSARSISLTQTDSASLCLGFYSPGASQQSHVHDLPTVSLMLCGAVGETVGRTDSRAIAGWLSIKPPGVRHTDHYGPDGAVILSAVIRDQALWSAVVPSPRWAWKPLPREARRTIAAGLSDLVTMRAETLLIELLAAASPLPAAKATPAWLLQAADRIREDPSGRIDRVADDCGVHPVYFARCFQRHFGVSPRQYRLQAKTSAAVGSGLFRDGGIAQAAHGAGFADQSHMARAVRQSIGLPLSRLRSLRKLSAKAGPQS